MASNFTEKVDQILTLSPSAALEDTHSKKSRTRRRKGFAKPRRIEPASSELAVQATPSKNLSSVLDRVLKVKQTEAERSNENPDANMIDVHETLALHHHSPKNSASSPTAVASPESLYMSEKLDDVISDSVNANSKLRHRSSDDVSSKILYDVSNSIQRTLSSEERQRKGSDNRSQEVPEVLQRSNSRISVTSPPQITSAPFLHSTAYDTMNGNPTNAIVAMAAGMGLPTMIPTSAIMTSAVPPLMAFHQSHMSHKSSSYAEKSGNDITSAQRDVHMIGSGRGIIGSVGGPPRNSISPSPEEKAQYKRPPHTYPALIASAILDSPGNLITLRGIYDYIMNNFPYYKYCHDKSAWQNSIRHNLSLNQCFVKVPRYENAAKSNYWTMTREGFEEFGNENSFKRRRRRGATLAPISAYKSKKYQTDSTKNGGKNKNENKNRSAVNGPVVPHSEEDYVVPLPSQLMGLAAAWGPGLRQADETQVKGRKRSLSPQSQEEAKQAKLMILQQADGRTMGDDNKQSNSIDEITGAFSSFNKAQSQLLPTNFQTWAPRKILSTGLLPKIDRSSPVNSSQSNSTSTEIFNNGSTPVLMDGVEVGSEIRLRSDSSSGLPVSHYRCGFCSYAYVSTSGIVLEQHVRMLHQLEVTNATAKAVAAAAVAKSHDALSENSSDVNKRLMLQNLMNGLSSTSMMTTAQSNNLLTSQTSVGNTGATFPYSGSFSSGFLNDSIIRSMAEQTATSQSSVLAGDCGLSSVEALAYQRQALNNVLQQAAAAASVSTPSSQDQLRSLYQQVMMQNPFLANSGMFPRQVSLPDSDESNQLKQQFWQYQQHIIKQMKTLSEERNSPAARTVADQDRSSPKKSSSTYSDGENDIKQSIHAWKQCTKCNFTAKGEHGLELHYRKAHNDADEKSLRSMGSNSLNENEDDLISIELSACENKFNQRSESPLASSAFPTPPLSNSPAYTKRHFVPLDLSATKQESSLTASASTQTSCDTDESDKRTCVHCDITFGDEMMHALHMSCHDAEDPFKCKVCGQKCNERYYFNVHLLRGLHQNDSANLAPDVPSEAPLVDNVPRCHSNSSDIASGYELNVSQE